MVLLSISVFVFFNSFWSSNYGSPLKLNQACVVPATRFETSVSTTRSLGLLNFSLHLSNIKIITAKYWFY